MITVSENFKNAVYAPKRATVGRLTFEIIDTDAFNDNVKSISSEASFSRKDQVTNKIREMSTKYATLEPNYWKLDGSFALPPKPDEDGFEVGWWGNNLCDNSGKFSPNEILALSFTKAHSSIGLTIAFDTRINEYAADFDISAYKLDGTLINTYSVTSNTEALYIFNTPISNYGKIVLTIKKWCKGNRRARVKNIDFGIIKQYEDRKLVKMNITEQVDILSDTLPSNELKFTVDNSDKAFNILNPEGLYAYLQEMQEVKAEIGVILDNENTEYIPMGKYYLNDWQSDEKAITATFTAKDILNILDNIPFTMFGSGNLYDVSVNVMNIAGIKDYYIDFKLKDISTNGFKEKLSCRKALQYIAIASKACVFQDRYGTLNVKQFATLDVSTSYINFCGQFDLFCGAAYPSTDNGFDIKHITFDNTYNVPQIKLDSLIKTVIIVVHNEGNKTEVSFDNSSVVSGVALKVDNPLINTNVHAEEVATWIINERNLRAIYSVNWRQNPCLEATDIILIEDGYGSKKQSRITKQEFEYQGYLKGKTESRGGV